MHTNKSSVAFKKVTELFTVETENNTDSNLKHGPLAGLFSADPIHLFI